RPRRYFNLFVTFLLSGLWHGASWNFVIWGAINGIYQIIEDILKPARKKLDLLLNSNTDAFSYKLGGMVSTFCLWSFSCIFFRADSFPQATTYIKNLFTVFNPWVLFDGRLYSFELNQSEAGILIGSILILTLVDGLKRCTGKGLDDILFQQNTPFRWLVIVALVAVIIVFGEYGINFDSTQFIYFA
ncbi:MAG: MBOAT family protein, partial [Bacilli bacterium]|nr:MBOAT family protein [Bacilli bacterium]